MYTYCCILPLLREIKIIDKNEYSIKEIQNKTIIFSYALNLNHFKDFRLGNIVICRLQRYAIYRAAFRYNALN